MRKALKILRQIVTILISMTAGCGPIIRTVEWPEIELHRGSIDLKIAPPLTDPTRDTQAARLPPF